MKTPSEIAHELCGSCGAQINENVCLNCGLITEAKYRPATIRMKRGTVIEADHVRVVRLKRGGEVIYAGVGPGEGHTTVYKRNPSKRKWPNMLRLPDFTKHYYSLSPDFHERSIPDEHGHYDAHTNFTIKRMFGKMMTMNPKNIASIEWK